MRFTTKLITSRSGNIVQIQINNMKAFHALDIDMIRCFDESLSAWNQEDSIKCLIVSSSSKENNNVRNKKHIFCAGGDVKRIYEAGLGLNDKQADINAHMQGKHGFGSPGLTTADFFREEYSLYYKLATTNDESRPQISLWDGIVIGAGVGISIYGQYRIATEHSIFSMPEAAIGLFPDVGKTYWLVAKNTKLGKFGLGLGRYIILTCARLKADDLMYTGLATHYVPSIQLEDLKQAIISNFYTSIEEEGSAERNMDQILMSFHEPITNNGLDSFLAKHKDEIDATFSKDTVEDIMIALEQLGTDFAKDTLNTLQKMSPTSLKVTFEALKRGILLPNVGECLRMEYRMIQRFMKKDSDFYEGI